MPRPLILAVLALGAAVILAMIAAGIPPGHSAAFNYAWSTQYSEAVSWSSPFPRWLPGLWNGLGGADFFFYAPLPFWAGAALVGPLCGGCAPETAMVIASALFLVGSGWSMWAFLRHFFEPRAAAAGAVIYVILPYHLLVDWFARQAVGEFTAYAFLPLVALGIERLRRDLSGGWILTLGVAGLCLSHLPSALLAGHVFGLVCLAFAVLAGGRLLARLRLLAAFAWHGLLGLGLAAFYWLPAVALLDTVSPAALFSDYFEAPRWLFGFWSRPPDRIAALVLACVACAAPILLAATLRLRGPSLVWLVLPAGVAIVMNLSVTELIWREWVISRVQFPWRLTMFLDFSTAFAGAFLASGALSAGRWRILAAALALAGAPYALLASRVTYTQPAAEFAAQRTDWAGAAEYLSPEMGAVLADRLGLQELTLFDHKAITGAIAALSQEVEEAGESVEMSRSDARTLIVTPASGHDRIALPVQYWTFWEAETAEGEPLRIVPHPRFGTLEVEAPPGGFVGTPVTVRLPLHSSERFGWAASGLVAILLIGGLARHRAGRRRS